MRPLVAGNSTGKSMAGMLEPVKPKKVMPGAFQPTTRLQKRGGRRGYRSFDEARCADMCMQMRFAREWAEAKLKKERREQHEANLKAKEEQ